MTFSRILGTLITWKGENIYLGVAKSSIPPLSPNLISKYAPVLGTTIRGVFSGGEKGALPPPEIFAENATPPTVAYVDK